MAGQLIGSGSALVRVAVVPVQVSLVAVGLPILAWDAARRAVREGSARRADRGWLPAAGLLERRGAENEA